MKRIIGNDLDSLLESDQLSRERRIGNAFFGFGKFPSSMFSKFIHSYIYSAYTCTHLSSVIVLGTLYFSISRGLQELGLMGAYTRASLILGQHCFIIKACFSLCHLLSMIRSMDMFCHFDGKNKDRQSGFNACQRCTLPFQESFRLSCICTL